MEAPEIDPKFLTKLKKVPKKGVHILGTWITLPLELRTLSEFLIQKLHDLPEDGGFVKLNRWRTLFGDLFCEFVDCITKSPRSDQLDVIVDKLRNLIKDLPPGTLPSKESVLAILKPIMKPPSDDVKEEDDDYDKTVGYSHFVHPEPGKLAEPAKTILSMWFNEYDPTHLIAFEQSVIEQMRKDPVTLDWLNNSIRGWDDPENEIVKGVRLVESCNGHPVLITSSFYLMFAEQSCIDKNVFPISHAFITVLQLLHEAGHIDQDCLDEKRNVMQCFLMACENLEDVLEKGDDQNCFKVARRMAMPKNYFQGPPPRILLVSNNIGIGYLECLYIREKLDRPDWFHTMCQALGLGIALGIPQKMNPIELNYVCPGAPASSDGKIKAKPCVTKNFTSKTPVTMVGARTPENPLRGYFVCVACRNHGTTFEKLEISELKKILANSQS